MLEPAPVALQALMAAGCAPAQNPVGILRLSGHPVPVPHTPTVQDFFPSRGPHTLGRREHGSARKEGAGERRKWEELTGPGEVKWIRSKESQ